MLRLPPFAYHRPVALDEAVALLAGEGAAEDRAIRAVAGGTDLFPNLKRRQDRADVVVGLNAVPELRGIAEDGDDLRIGATASLAEVERDSRVQHGYPALVEAIASISTPTLRSMGTLGGNLLIDTRCNYLNQTEEWRRAVDYCMKERGKVCWVAPSSPRCWAVSSCDSAPMLAALGARVLLVGPQGERTLTVDDLYRDDGIAWLTKAPEEILVDIRLPAASRAPRCRAAFRKLRRRGSIDFAVLSVAAALWTDESGIVEKASVRLGGVASRPLAVPRAEQWLLGRSPDEESLAAAARLCREAATPLDNTDFAAQWRSSMVEVYALDTLRSCLPPEQSPG